MATANLNFNTFGKFSSHAFASAVARVTALLLAFLVRWLHNRRSDRVAGWFVAGCFLHSTMQINGEPTALEPS